MLWQSVSRAIGTLIVRPSLSEPRCGSGGLSIARFPLAKTRIRESSWECWSFAVITLKYKLMLSALDSSIAFLFNSLDESTRSPSMNMINENRGYAASFEPSFRCRDERLDNREIALATPRETARESSKKILSTRCNPVIPRKTARFGRAGVTRSFARKRRWTLDERTFAGNWRNCPGKGKR